MVKSAGAQPNQSLIDGISILQTIAVSEKPIGCLEVSSLLGMENTKVNRLLKTLHFLGLAEQVSNRKYTAGSGINVLAAQSLYASGLLRKAILPMEQLQSFGRVVALGVLWRDSVSFLYHAQPGMSSGEAIGRIGLHRASASGVGIALLAEESETMVRSLYKDKIIPGFPDGIDSLLEVLRETKKNGYARIQISPSKPNIAIYAEQIHYTIAVPVGKPVTSALGLSGWIPDSTTADVVSALMVAKNEIESVDEYSSNFRLITEYGERFKNHIPL